MSLDTSAHVTKFDAWSLHRYYFASILHDRIRLNGWRRRHLQTKSFSQSRLPTACLRGPDPSHELASPRLDLDDSWPHRLPR